MHPSSLFPILSLLALPVANGAITFNLNFLNAAGETWTSARQNLISQAANEWGSLFVNDYTIDVDVTFTNAGTGGYLGQWSGGLSYFVGDDVTPWYSGVSHTLNFNADLMDAGATNYLWFDPSPTTDGDQPFAAWDALSVARHEFGHLLGFTSAGFYESNKGTGSAIDHWGNQLSGSNPLTFDATGLNVAMFSDAHVHGSIGANTTDLMVPAIANGLRREISSLDLQMLSLAYGYALIPEAASISALVGGLGLLAFAFRRRTAKRGQPNVSCFSSCA